MSYFLCHPQRYDTDNGKKGENESNNFFDYFVLPFMVMQIKCTIKEGYIKNTMSLDMENHWYWLHFLNVVHLSNRIVEHMG